MMSYVVNVHLHFDYVNVVGVVVVCVQVDVALMDCQHHLPYFALLDHSAVVDLNLIDSVFVIVHYLQNVMMNIHSLMLDVVVAAVNLDAELANNLRLKSYCYGQN